MEDDGGMTADLLGTQLSKRRRTGADSKSWKMPIMPRVIQSVDTQLADVAWCTRMLESGSPHLPAFVMVYLAYFFGWRAGTVSAICVGDVEVSIG